MFLNDFRLILSHYGTDSVYGNAPSLIFIHAQDMKRPEFKHPLGLFRDAFRD